MEKIRKEFQQLAIAKIRDDIEGSIHWTRALLGRGVPPRTIFEMLGVTSMLRIVADESGERLERVEQTHPAPCLVEKFGSARQF